MGTQDLTDQMQKAERAGMKDGTQISGLGRWVGGGGIDWVDESWFVGRGLHYILSRVTCID